MRPEPSETTKRNVTSMLFSKKAKAVVSASFTSPEQVLGEIYELMVKMDEQKKLEEEQKKSDEWDRQDALERRNQELIKALTGRKKPKKKVVEEKKKEIVKDVEKKGKKVEKETQTETTTAPKETGKATKEVTTTSKEPPKVTKETTTPKETPKQVAEKPPEVKPAPEVGPTPGLPRARVRAGAKEPTAPVTSPPAKVAPVKPATPPVTPPVTQTPIIPPIAAATGVAGLTMSSIALARIKEKEGYVGKAYYDPKKGDPRKLYSVGYGHQITDDEIKNGFILVGQKKVPVVGERGKDTILSKEDADVLIKQDYQKYEDNAKKIPNFDKLNPKAQAALVDMTYNMGVNWYKKWPMLLQQLENLELDKASANILSSDYAKQVGKRASENAESIKSGLKDVPQINPNIPSTKIENASKENQQLNNSLDAKSKTTSVNNTNISVQKSQQTSQQKVEDDRPIIIKKAQQ